MTPWDEKNNATSKTTNQTLPSRSSLERPEARRPELLSPAGERSSGRRASGRSNEEREGSVWLVVLEVALFFSSQGVMSKG